jgi:hypothetical protein
VPLSSTHPYGNIFRKYEDIDKNKKYLFVEKMSCYLANQQKSNKIKNSIILYMLFEGTNPGGMMTITFFVFLAKKKSAKNYL